MNMDTIKECAEKYNTPFYLFDIPKLYEWCEQVKSVFEGTASLCYAIKANPFLLPYMDKITGHFEVCSPGEYSICLKYAIPSEKIVLSGVYKSKENIEQAFDNDFKGIITLESPNHFRLLKEVAAERNLSNIKILPRLSSNNKFGMSKNDIIAIINECRSLPEFKLTGLQYFSGTQKKRISVIEKELADIDAFCDEINQKTGTKITFLEYGPGIFYDYYDKSDILASAKAVNEAVKPYTDKYGFSLESGRYLSAPCGHYVTKVVDMKHTEGTNYCLVDGGIHHVNYYGRMLNMNVPDVTHIHVGEDNPCGETENTNTDNLCMGTGNNGTENTGNSGDTWTVGGALCTVNDVLLRNYKLTDLKENDLLVFNDTGAYSCTESGVLFLSRDMPRIVALEPNGNYKLLRDMIESYKFNCEI